MEPLFRESRSAGDEVLINQVGLVRVIIKDLQESNCSRDVLCFLFPIEVVVCYPLSVSKSMSK